MGGAQHRIKRKKVSWVPASMALLPMDVVGQLPRAPTAMPSLTLWAKICPSYPTILCQIPGSKHQENKPYVNTNPQEKHILLPPNFKLPDRFRQYEFFTLTPCIPLALKLLSKKILRNTNEITGIPRHLRIMKNVPTWQLGVSICQDGCRIESLEESQVKNNHPILSWNCLWCFFLASRCSAVSLLRR